MYRFLDHPSEAYVEVEAESTEHVFRDAALALFELMTNTALVEAKRAFEVHLEAPDRALLLIDWMNRLIWIHEVENVFLSRFDVRMDHNENWKLEGIVNGEPISAHHEKRVHAKSATYAKLEWKESENGFRARFVIDI